MCRVSLFFSIGAPLSCAGLAGPCGESTSNAFLLVLVISRHLGCSFLYSCFLVCGAGQQGCRDCQGLIGRARVVFERDA